MNSLIELWHSTGLYQIHWDQAAMIVIGLLLLYLAIVRGFEPLLLVPIGFGGVLANIPGVDIAVGDGILYQLYSMGIGSGLFPLLIFMGVGAMTDFGPLLANPRTLFLGAAAQFGIFATLLGALVLTDMGVFDFTIAEAIEAPRIHHQWLPDVTSFESWGFSPDTVRLYREKGHEMRQRGSQGAAMGVYHDRDNGLFLGGADSRRGDAGAVGY